MSAPASQSGDGAGPARPAAIIRLRPSVSFAPLDSGVLFKDWDRSFTITGNRALYTLFERLLPHLERGVARGALLGALPENVRGVVGLLLDRLEEHEMCFALDSEREAPADAEAFPQAMAYLESVAPDPYAAFARIRAARVAAVGHGQALFAAVRALVAMGVGRLDCWTAPPSAEASVDARAEDDRLRDCLRAQALVAGEVRPIDMIDALAGADVDLIIHLQDGMARDAVDAISARPLLQGVLGADMGLAGPLRVDRGPGLADALARFHGTLGPAPAGQAQRPAPVLAGLLGNAVAFEAFKHLAGLPTPAAQGRAVMVTREPLAVSHHLILPVPAARSAAGESLDADTLASALADMRRVEEPPAQQALVDALRELADESFGVLALPHPGDLPQMPIFTCRAKAHPTGAGAVGDAIGFADDPTEAYLRAGARGLGLLAEAGAAHELPTLTLDGTAGTTMARAAMSLAVGHSYETWLEEGLHGCLLRCLGDAVDARLPVTVRRVVNPDGPGRLTGSIALRWKTLTLRFGQEIVVMHGVLPAVPGVHLAAVIANGVTAGLGAGGTQAVALDHALREAVARAALAESGVALPARPALVAPDTAADAPAEAAAGEEDIWSAQGSLAGTLDALARLGVAVLVHPWCGVPALHRQGFLIGWVGLHVG